MREKLNQRFIEIFNAADLPYPVSVVGVGSVGSNVALHLAKLGIENIKVFDHDVVDTPNIGVSIPYGWDDIGKYKVEALRDRIKQLTGIEIKISNKRAEEDKSYLNNGIIISAVDTIEARKNIWKDIMDTRKCKLYIDLASGGGLLFGRTVEIDSPSDVTWYSLHLAPLRDEDFPDIPCTMRSTIHGTSVLAVYVAYMIIQYTYKRFVKRETTPLSDREFRFAIGINSVY